MAYLTTDDGKRVYYEDYGSGETAVVLVHGWGMGLRVWDYSLGTLTAAGYRVVAIDHRGCGKSDKDFADVGINAIASDVVALVGQLGLRKVVLNGWSLGGAVVVEAARQLGDTCAGLVLTCAATPCYLQKPDYAYGGTDEALAETLEAMLADRVNFLAGLSAGVCASEVSQSVVDWLWAMFMTSSPLAAQALGELGPLDQREVLAQLDVPVMSIVGAQDAVVDPQVCRSVADYSPRATIVEFEDSGHAPFIDEAQRYNDTVLIFLGENL
jgi:pimeloyl-ACP methyl ester carboxylesterase